MSDDLHVAVDAGGEPTRRRTILLLAPDVPQPVGGGGARAYHIVRALGVSHRVHLVSLLREDNQHIPADARAVCASIMQPPAETGGGRGSSSLGVLLAPWHAGGRDLLLAGARNCCRRSERFTREGSTRRGIRAVYSSLIQAEVSIGTRYFGMRPARTMERAYEFEAVLPRLKQLAGEESIDIIWIEHSYLFPFVPVLRKLFPAARLVCNAHNVEYLLHERMADVVRSVSARRWYRVQAKACRSMEIQGYRACDLVLTCSEGEKQIVETLAPGVRVRTIPNGVDTAHFLRSGKEDLRPTILFTGGMSYPPNLDAARWFAAEIFPRVRAAYPNCTFLIAGSQAGTQCAGLARPESGIEIASDVPDMRICFDRSWVVVVPLRAGSGTRIKILEAMSMGCPIVSTPLGAEGIEAIDGRHLLLAESPADFARQVVALIGDAEARREIGRAARDLVCRKYDWNRLEQDLLGEVFAGFHTHGVAVR